MNDNSTPQTNKLACIRCRLKRQKCDRKLNGCTRCKGTIFKCCYPERKKRRRKHEISQISSPSMTYIPNDMAPVLYSNMSSSPQIGYSQDSSTTFSPYLSAPSTPLMTSGPFITDELFMNDLASIYLTYIYPSFQIFTPEDFQQKANFWAFNNSIHLVAYYYAYPDQQQSPMAETMKKMHAWTYRQVSQMTPNLKTLQTLANLNLIRYLQRDRETFDLELHQLARISKQLGLHKYSQKFGDKLNFKRNLIYMHLKSLQLASF
ncbi:hypothetical protein CONCODRAFT_104659 [Conidiobolus coronatus NRRL 28638]|uniref:Zn(2)-C6 fungal-type domain-containing protein n=1 Tax=Conidiobolus coronatus (strain ATCC 28846 / CBS 209.66 / NRRL 28638) TaxID=796925 RepID=A0A137P0W2_CONC2|nr:hypothetical protein CONCODRAFT_104659 [Conidiobolus coronatus NRRL 28638]|eukprot:KXN68511.1 hypothetical protein CONCODRAFT_104659 [Conidiobolus coronatus NRRL 28638]